jgi:molybdopterin molybdotransferase
LQERCEKIGDTVLVADGLFPGANIRRSGEDAGKDSIIVEAGNLVDARHIAILSASGIAHVEVRPRIKVGLLSNGDELGQLGSPLAPGQIYDANRAMLKALLRKPWVEILDFGGHGDDLEGLTRTVASAAERADIVISSGGVAGSETDHVARAMLDAGGEVRRFRLALKPGRPLLAGRIGRAAMLGLPGNTVAALVDFLLFGWPLLGECAGVPVTRPRGRPAIASAAIAHAAGRMEFAPARVAARDECGRLWLEKLGGCGSARLRPLILADGLLEIPAEVGDLPEGASVTYHAFDGLFGTECRTDRPQRGERTGSKEQEFQETGFVAF